KHLRLAALGSSGLRRIAKGLQEMDISRCALAFPCWTLDIERWTLDIECWILDIGNRSFSVGYWKLEIGN
ncbi:MAG: hypothetical protein NTX50_27805, partial [Candidatus Sumerlaeota bacterium]|nr:hypothetical protein [Candidatus Sumerlaeota bacterium]